MKESLFNKVAGLMPEVCELIKKETLTQIFPVKMRKTTFLFIEHLWWLLLNQEWICVVSSGFPIKSRNEVP